MKKVVSIYIIITIILLYLYVPMASVQINMHIIRFAKYEHH